MKAEITNGNLEIFTVQKFALDGDIDLSEMGITALLDNLKVGGKIYR